MDEYISREELRKHLKECYDNEFFDADMRKSTIGIDVYVENMPATDVQPVKHGHWIEVTPRHSKCSICDTTCLIAVYPISKNANYCPNCGADMRGDTNE